MSRTKALMIPPVEYIYSYGEMLHLVFFVFQPVLSICQDPCLHNMINGFLIAQYCPLAGAAEPCLFPTSCMYYCVVNIVTVTVGNNIES